MRCAVYIRVSSPHRPGAGSDDSLERQHTDNQRAQLLEFVRSAGWTLAREYEDRDTGGKSDRSQFQRLMDDASKRKFDVVLFWSLDRFSREGVYETLHHLRYLDSHGVGFRSYTEQYLDSCGIFKDAVLAILAVIAKQERVRMSERIRAGLDYARSQGKRFGPRPKDLNMDVLRLGLEAGKTGKEIAAMLGCSRSTVYERMRLDGIRKPEQSPSGGTV
jgi:DNA invertase Pin-like site-specific DNA recombinase